MRWEVTTGGFSGRPTSRPKPGTNRSLGWDRLPAPKPHSRKAARPVAGGRSIRGDSRPDGARTEPNGACSTSTPPHPSGSTRGSFLERRTESLLSDNYFSTTDASPSDNFRRSPSVRAAGESPLVVLDAQEFIRRFLLHVLPPHFVKVRYIGLWSPAVTICAKQRPGSQPAPLPLHRRCPTANRPPRRAETRR